jgi:hypothetical protein
MEGKKSGGVEELKGLEGERTKMILERKNIKCTNEALSHKYNL